jgi:hypothetical protein
MSTRTTTPPPVDCDACGKEITEAKEGFLDCEVVDLHDGTPVKDVCADCREKPLSAIFPHILKRLSGHPMRKVAAPAVTEPVELAAGEDEDEGADEPK